MSGARQRLVGHPAMSKTLIPTTGHGMGGPGPLDPQKQKPVNPPIQIPNPLAGLQQAFAKLTGDITAGFNAATADLLGGGEVLVGIALIIGGLLVATGQAGRVARGAGRAGLFAASRGAVR